MEEIDPNLIREFEEWKIENQNNIPDPSRRFTMVAFFAASSGNPNGDPSANNRPRTIVWDNAEEGGLVSPDSVKYKVKVVFQKLGLECYAIGSSYAKREEAAKHENPNQFIIDRYIDSRLFGHVLTKPINKNRHGPIRVMWALSTCPVFIEEFSKTTSHITGKEAADEGHKNKPHTAYGLIPGREGECGCYPYRQIIDYTPDRNVTRDDLAAFIFALSRHAFTTTNSCNRTMYEVGVVVFAESQYQFENTKSWVKIRRNNENNLPPIASDFEFDFSVPQGVKVYGPFCPNNTDPSSLAYKLAAMKK